MRTAPSALAALAAAAAFAKAGTNAPPPAASWEDARDARAWQSAHPATPPAAAASHANTADARAAEILIGCISRLPLEAYEFSGDIVMRKAYGVELKRLKFKSKISWNPAAPFAEYEIRNASGALLETVRAARRGAGAALERSVGEAREPVPAPAMNDSVQGTDVSWMDLTMDFVWWGSPVAEGGGVKRVRGRDCEVLRVRPPAPLPGCSAVRLWVDAEQSVVLQAAQLDADGAETRRMWVDSVQKINGRWLVKNIEVETPASGRRTKIHVDSARPAAAQK